MLKKYKNGFIQIIRSKGFDPQDFHAEEKVIDGRQGFVIGFRDSHLRFVARNSDDSHAEFDYKHSCFGPGAHETEYLPVDGWTGIGAVYGAFEDWLEKAVKVYTDDLIEPDLWAQLECQKPFITGCILQEDDIRPFSEREKRQLRASISEFRSIVSETFQPSQEQMKVIDNHLNYLSKALDRLNRIDWRGLALSTTISISIALSLDTERGRILFNLFREVFSKLLHLLR